MDSSGSGGDDGVRTGAPHPTSRSVREVVQGSHGGGSTQEVALWLISSAVEAAREGFCITNADLDDLRIVYVNPAFSRITGYEFSEVVGRSPVMLQGELSDRRVLDRLRADLEAGRDFHGQTMNYHKNGMPFLMDWYITALRNPCGEITHYLAVQRDRTAQRTREATRIRIEAAMRQTDDAILLLDGDRQIVFANPAFRQLMAAPDEAVEGRRVTGLPQKLICDQDDGSLSDALEQGTEWRGFCTYRSDEGEDRQISGTLTPVRDADGVLDGFVVVCRDVTERLRLESIAEAVNLSENLGFIFSGIRHELGNPINSMKAALSVVRAGIDRYSRDKIVSYLDAVMVELARVEDLLASLRSFNASELPVIEPVDVEAFLERLEQLLGVTPRGPGTTFEIVPVAEPLTVAADPRALHQVLLNLVANAFDAVADREHGEVTLSVRRQGNRFILFEVRDNGPGFSVTQDNLLRPFYTTKRQGSGLGLAISNKLVARMRGTLTFDTPGEGGARVTVTLDAADV